MEDEYRAKLSKHLVEVHGVLEGFVNSRVTTLDQIQGRHREDHVDAAGRPFNEGDLPWLAWHTHEGMESATEGGVSA